MLQKTILFVLLCTSFIGFSQETTSEITPLKHEVKINALSLIALEAIDLTYEHIISPETSFGVSLYVFAGDEDEDFSDEFKTFSITPYYRNYFSKKYNQGFFLEGFAMYNRRNLYTYDSSYDDFNNRIDNDKKETENAFALGLTAGGKWVTKRGLIAEVSFGVGRNLFSNSDFPIITRGGISIGKRF